MNINLTPVAAAIFFSLGPVYAAGGSAGGNGVSNIGGLIGGESVGDPGTTGEGQDGDPVTNPSPIVLESEVITGLQGVAGADGAAGAGGAGGTGGASIIGGISIGGAGGSSPNGVSTPGGLGGTISNVQITLDNVELNGSTAAGVKGGDASTKGGAGAGGSAGGSVFGGISIGGAGGYSDSTDLYGYLYASGGEAGGINSVTIGISGISRSSILLTGASGGQGGDAASQGGGGAGGHAGGSVFGGASTGGAGGYANSNIAAFASGGSGGEVWGVEITLDNITLNGSSAVGGQGGQASSLGGGGAGGHGGGSVFGGISTGGAGGFSSMNETRKNSFAGGGRGGDLSLIQITLDNVILNGSNAEGGRGGNASSDGGGGAGGHGGGSVFGGISTGGAGGYSFSNDDYIITVDAGGGYGGHIRNVQITLNNVELNGSNAVGGQGGSASSKGGAGIDGYGGGSVFGGISIGGAGGYANSTNSANSASGGDGGFVSNNTITISGKSDISGSIYGGISQGGRKGVADYAEDGKGLPVIYNTITLIGDQITIGGSIFGGLSLNGDGSENLDPTYSDFYANNTINIQSAHFVLNGELRNFQNYNWLLPEEQFDGETIITVSTSPVDINNTIHSVDVKATGNTLDGGDQVVLITKVTGQPNLKSRTYIEQGFFIVYDAEMVVQNNGLAGNSLVLNVLGERGGSADGKIHPESEEFLKGRIAQLAIVDQGADMISDGISYARSSIRKKDANIFTIVDGGTNKYKNGGVSTLKLNDFKFAVGAAKAVAFDNRSVGMVGAFFEHGNGNYRGYNNFDYFGDTRSSGKLRYNGIGFMLHMDVAGTDFSKVEKKINIFDDKYGLYVDAALRFGHVSADFHSPDMVNGAGVEASYKTKSRYMSAMAGVGYVWTLDAKQAVDLYGRYTFSRLNGKNIQVVDEAMNAGTAHSQRLRVGARYGYAYSDKVTPYAGLAVEHNFTGDVTGSAYGFTIKETSLKGSTGIVEAGVMVKPKGADDPFSMHFGVQGHFGQHKGVTAGVRARYVF